MNPRFNFLSLWIFKTKEVAVHLQEAADPHESDMVLSMPQRNVFQRAARVNHIPTSAISQQNVGIRVVTWTHSPPHCSGQSVLGRLPAWKAQMTVLCLLPIT